MPCGGIYPTKPVHSRCHFCNKKQRNGKYPDHYIEEWDDMIHGDCILPFLGSPMGWMVLREPHRHEVTIWTGDFLIELVPAAYPDSERDYVARLCRYDRLAGTPKFIRPLDKTDAEEQANLEDAPF